MIGERAERLKRIFVVKHTCSNDERNTPAGLPIGNGAPVVARRGVAGADGRRLRLRAPALRARGLRAPAYVYSNFFSNVWLLVIVGKL